MVEKNIENLKKEYLNLKIMKKSGQLTDTSQFKKIRKKIANQLTKESLKKDA
ncbi:MAG: 50S ribosomal protein L29 [Pelagibacteraceae bacterium]|nr:50S ribosomal protein L29 [Pelagibacteraceae bacterium]|tara:strand:- start:3 stop:158 length:156 start_codon:yes stop_codon:yes gene_type:complete